MQAKIDEFCALSFDEVDAAEQMGLTYRMLVGLKSLGETLSFWEGEQKCEEEAFKLLGLEEDDMHIIGRTIRRAMKLVDSNRYRDAYERMRSARQWFQAADGQTLDGQRTQLRAAAADRKSAKAEKQAKVVHKPEEEDASAGEWMQVTTKKTVRQPGASDGDMKPAWARANERLKALAARR